MEVPKGYVQGKGLLEAGYPWLTPKSVDFLEVYCSSDHRVLEFGCGGSTIFFARRCAHVTGCESSPEWADAVKVELAKNHLKNARIFTTQLVPPDALDRQYDIAVIDSTHLQRSVATANAMTVVRQEGIIVVDNYNRNYCDLVRKMLDSFPYKDYDDPAWDGNGTRIYVLHRSYKGKK